MKLKRGKKHTNCKEHFGRGIIVSDRKPRPSHVSFWFCFSLVEKEAPFWLTTITERSNSDPKKTGNYFRHSIENMPAGLFIFTTGRMNVLLKEYIVTTETTTETYVGLATNFKERYRNHQTSFRHSKRRNETVWNLQDAKKPFRIKWKVLKRCNKPYSNISKKCNLCLDEKFIIICKKELCSLNRRNELASS